jgi:hypothetical protein
VIGGSVSVHVAAVARYSVDVTNTRSAVATVTICFYASAAFSRISAGYLQCEVVLQMSVEFQL